MIQRQQNKTNPFSLDLIQPRAITTNNNEQVLIQPSAFEPREWFQKVARLPELATAGPFGGEQGSSALSEAFSQLVGAAEASSSAAAAASAAAAPAARPPVAVPGFSQRTAAALLRLLDLIRESKGGGGGSASASSYFADAAAATAEDDAEGNNANASPSPSSPAATVYVITHALSDPAAFAPALRAAAADRVGVCLLFVFFSSSSLF